MKRVEADDAVDARVRQVDPSSVELEELPARASPMTGSRAYSSRAIDSAVGDTSRRVTRQPSCVRKRDSQPVPAPNSSTVVPGSAGGPAAASRRRAAAAACPSGC